MTLTAAQLARPHNHRWYRLASDDAFIADLAEIVDGHTAQVVLQSGPPLRLFLLVTFPAEWNDKAEYAAASGLIIDAAKVRDVDLRPAEPGEVDWQTGLRLAASHHIEITGQPDANQNQER